MATYYTCPRDWNNGLNWTTQQCKGKGLRVHLLKTPFTETIYESWKYRNDYCLENTVSNDIGTKIIDTLKYWARMKSKLRAHIGRLMMQLS